MSDEPDHPQTDVDVAAMREIRDRLIEISIDHERAMHDGNPCLNFRFGAVAAVGIHSPEDLLARMETLERSDIWVFVALEDDGTVVNATGFYPDEHSAFLAGEEYTRAWVCDGDDDAPPSTRAIPLFIDRRQIDG